MQVVRYLVPCLLLVAACGKNIPKQQERPEDVAKATFAALKAGGIGPLEPYLMTAEETKRITGIDLDDSAERERWNGRLAQQHDRLDVDWATAEPGKPKVKYDALGQGAMVTLPIRSERGTVSVEIAVTKVGRRFVFSGVKPGAGAEKKQAAPEPDEEED
jgi:hypothetical protein